MADMTDQELIKQAVELAPEWKLERNAVRVNGVRIYYQIQPILADKDLPQWILDALAAELVRQVDALEGTHVSTIKSGSEVWRSVFVGEIRTAIKCLGSHSGPDRTMNTLRCIVESGVLAAGNN